MAFVITSPQPPHIFSSCNQLACGLRQVSQQNLTSDVKTGTNCRQSGKGETLAQSAMQLNCYDNLLPTPFGLSTPGPGRSKHNFCSELTQHRSMVDLDTTLRNRPNLVAFLNASQVDQQCANRCDVRWMSRNHMSSTNSINETNQLSNVGLARFSIHDLIQQESVIVPFNYPVDQPSLLVRVECGKPGCRCVLKDEHAMALKIVTNVTLVQATWIRSNEPVFLKVGMPFSGTSHVQPTTSPSVRDSTKVGRNASMIITNCCPAWFEVLNHNWMDSSYHAEVPVWSTCKALWRSKPEYFLVRKQLQCMFSTPPQQQSGPTGLGDSSKSKNLVININADTVFNISPGTVLRLLDCRLCRLVHCKGGNQESALSLGFIGRHRTKTVSMLQCAIAGASALSVVAGLSSNLPPQDVLSALASGPRLVYISLDSKSISCSPVASKKYSGTRGSSQLHSMISLLTHHRLPIIARPVDGLCTRDWIADTVTDKSNSNAQDSAGGHRLKQASLLLDGCFHGDLVFLEPISDYAGVKESASRTEEVGPHSRFFVVSTDMLSSHRFLLAEASSAAQLSTELKAHAAQVAQFLATSHPAQGLSYLLKHMEDITHSSNTGPSHVPLSRTLGPVRSGALSSGIQHALASVAASAAIATLDSEEYFRDPAYFMELKLDEQTKSLVDDGFPNERYKSSVCLTDCKNRTVTSCSSSLFANELNQMNALCDEIDDIYYYVRNGRFPPQSRSMSSLAPPFPPASLPEQVARISAPISPVQRTFKQNVPCSPPENTRISGYSCNNPEIARGIPSVTTPRFRGETTLQMYMVPSSSYAHISPVLQSKIEASTPPPTAQRQNPVSVANVEDRHIQAQKMAIPSHFDFANRQQKDVKLYTNTKFLQMATNVNSCMPNLVHPKTEKPNQENFSPTKHQRPEPVCFIPDQTLTVRYPNYVQANNSTEFAGHQSPGNQRKQHQLHQQSVYVSNRSAETPLMILNRERNVPLMVRSMNWDSRCATVHTRASSTEYKPSNLTERISQLAVTTTCPPRITDFTHCGYRAPVSTVRPNDSFLASACQSHKSPTGMANFHHYDEPASTHSNLKLQSHRPLKAFAESAAFHGSNSISRGSQGQMIGSCFTVSSDNVRNTYESNDIVKRENSSGSQQAIPFRQSPFDLNHETYQREQTIPNGCYTGKHHSVATRSRNDLTTSSPDTGIGSNFDGNPTVSLGTWYTTYSPVKHNLTHTWTTRTHDFNY